MMAITGRVRPESDKINLMKALGPLPPISVFSEIMTTSKFA